MERGVVTEQDSVVDYLPRLWLASGYNVGLIQAAEELGAFGKLTQAVTGEEFPERHAFNSSEVQVHRIIWATSQGELPDAKRPIRALSPISLLRRPSGQGQTPLRHHPLRRAVFDTADGDTDVDDTVCSRKGYKSAEATNEFTKKTAGEIETFVTPDVEDVSSASGLAAAPPPCPLVEAP